MTRAGLRTGTDLGLLAGALAGLALLGREVPLYGFGATGPDAQTLPRLALAALAAVLALRLVATLRRIRDVRIGPWRGWLPLLGTLAVIVAGLALMPRLGFIPCATAMGLATALGFGARHPVAVIGLPLIAATLVGLGARAVLHVPLP